MTQCDLTSIFGHYHFNQAATAWVKSEDDTSDVGMEAAESIVAMTAAGQMITSHSPLV